MRESDTHGKVQMWLLLSLAFLCESRFIIEGSPNVPEPHGTEGDIEGMFWKLSVVCVVSRNTWGGLYGSRFF